MTAFSDEDLDARLLAQAKTKWLKVAVIVAQAVRGYERFDEKRVAERLEALVHAGKLESVGDIQKWRFSEMRLPH